MSQELLDMKKDFSGKEVLELLFIQHQHVHENIKLADQKASAIIAANGALLALSYSLIQPSVKFTLFVGLVVCFVLVLSIAMAFLVIKPRGESNKNKFPSIFDPKQIAQYSLNDYQKRSSEISTEELLKDLRVFIYNRSCIDSEKYIFLRLSLIISAVGWILSLLFAALIKITG